jgi:hypothetical protein
MIRRSILLSSAAMFCASEAQSADAVVVADPEPFNYVEVCDAFGAGYFYLPGTETCLKIGGRVRFDLQVADSLTLYSAHGWKTRSRGELYLDTASDTEWGPFKTNTVMRYDFDGTYNDGVHTVPKLGAASISLAGFQVGLADSIFTSFPGYAGDVLSDGVVSYGPFEVNQINYIYDQGSGLRLAVGLEADEALEGSEIVNGDDYISNIAAGVGYKTEVMGVTLVGGYDERRDEGAIKARLDGAVGALSAFVMAAWSSSGDAVNNYAPGDSSGAAWGDWAAWAGIGYQLSDELKTNVQVSRSDNDAFGAAANIKWFPTQGVLVQPEISYTSFDHDDLSGHQWNAFMRVQRTF